jgi:outer membrane usher protein
MTYRAGDLISGALPWARPMRMGGFQIQRNFSLRPDLVTLPLPTFHGSAAVPSTVDVYLNNLRTFSGNVPAGPFEIRNLPVIAGAGTQRIVVRDVLGRETVTDQAFFASPKLLRGGMYDFSIEAGFPRIDYGLESDKYDSRPVASASLRGGIFDSLTLELRAEGTAGLLNGGAGIIAPTGTFGVASLAASASGERGGRSGAQVAASFEAAFGPAVFHMRSLRSIGDYMDLAALTADWTSPSTRFATTDYRPPRALDQVSLSFPLGSDPARLALTFTHVEDRAHESHKIFGISYSRSLTRDVNLFATAYKDFSNRDSYGIYAGLTRSFGQGVSATAGATASSSGSSFGLDATKAQPNTIGSYGWRLRDREGVEPNRAVAASYRAPFARIQGGIEQVGNALRGNAEIEGAVVVTGGDTYAANRIDDAFVIVDTGAPGVEVRHENRLVGTTDARGKLLVADLRSYQRNRITIDPKNLPVDADIPRTKEIVTPANRSGTIARFGIDTAQNAALVSFRNNGVFVPVGARGTLVGSNAHFIVGYDGAAFLRGLRSHNIVQITLADGHSCTAQFSFAPRPGTQVHIEDVSCI